MPHSLQQHFGVGAPSGHKQPIVLAIEEPPVPATDLLAMAPKIVQDLKQMLLTSEQLDSIEHQRVMDQTQPHLMIRQIAIRLLSLAKFVEGALHKYQCLHPDQPLPWKVAVEVEDLHETWTMLTTKWQDIRADEQFYRGVMTTVDNWETTSDQLQEQALKTLFSNEIIRKTMKLAVEFLTCELRTADAADLNVCERLRLAGIKSKINELLAESSGSAGTCQFDPVGP